MKFEYKPLINSKNKWATDDRKTSAKVAEVRPGQEEYETKRFFIVNQIFQGSVFW